MTRDEQLGRLRERQSWPVLVIGGGINGIGVLRDLALQGVDVLLVTKGDFAEGASAASSHMIHGGLRYLEQAEFRLVRESVNERNTLLRNASHFVKPLQTTIPLFTRFGGFFAAASRFLRLGTKPGKRGAFWVKLGMRLYDSYTRTSRVLPKHRFESAAEVLARIPQLNPRILCAAVYHDAWIACPERLCHEIVSDARDAHEGAVAINYLSAESMESGRVQLRCAVSGEMLEVEPDVVINATGAWIDRTNERLGESTRHIGGTKGSHLVLDHPELREVLDGEIFYENPDGRVCLVMPFHDRVIIGTTDIPVASPDVARCEEDEIEYILEAARRVLPGFTFDHSRVVCRYCGVRPLPYSDSPFPGMVSRDHSAPVAKPAGERSFSIYSLVGGKWTTFRAFAEEITDLVLADLGKSRVQATENIAIGGGRNMPAPGDASEQWLGSQAALDGLAIDRRRELLSRYGTRCIEVMTSVSGSDDRMLSSVQGYSSAEIAFICTQEDVVHLDDVLLRRTNLGLLGHVTRAGLDEIADICADALGWDASRTEEEKQRAAEILQRDFGYTFEQ